jgi:glyoxylase-like metal-dependent hydrolase (beta-lactamase superfamily II)
VVPIAPGILWIRLALPFALDHVNVYLIEDTGGWALVDTGIGDDRTIAAWEELLDGELRDKPISRLIVTHFHSDHSGMAGWLCRRLRVPLYMTRAEHLRSAALLQEQHSDTNKSWDRFYQRAGLSAERTGLIARSGHRYMQYTTGLVPARILAAGDELTIGRRNWRVLTGAGHSPEQLMLHCPVDGVFLSADHILARISPNVSVYHAEPEADPLGQYLTSLDHVPQSVDRDVLVLPGHNLPFRGLYARTAQLRLHHAARCDLIEAACRSAPKTVADLLPVLFPRPLDPQQTSFAVGEALAHVNYMLARQRLASSAGPNGVNEYRSR